MKQETPEESKSTIATVCHIRLAKTTVVQPGNELFIWGKIPARQVVSGDSIVECTKKFLQRTDLLAAGVRIPTGTNPNQIPICVVNLSGNPIKLYQLHFLLLFQRKAQFSLILYLSRRNKIMTQYQMYN